MFLPGRSIWWVLLTLQLSACDLEVYEHGSHDVICSQGLSECIVTDVMHIGKEGNETVAIQNLTPVVKLCCNDSVELYTLCLVIDTEICTGNTENPKASVTLCYKTASVLPTCKQVEFTVNSTAASQKNQTKVFRIIMKPDGVSFSDKVMVFNKHLSIIKEVVVPPLEEVCRQAGHEHVENCRVPAFNTAINTDTNNVELKFSESMTSPPSVCIQYEKNGVCQRWKSKNIPLYSVAPCMCFQVWAEAEESRMRSVSCPFINNGDFRRNILQNVSVSVRPARMNDHTMMLLWNLSAPCRLDGEVWPCQKTGTCKEILGFRQKVSNSNWTQNKKGLWVRKGAHEGIDLQLSPCVMVTIGGQELGPFCFKNTDRWRWSLVVVGILLLICLAALSFYFLQVYIKKWVWSWNHGGFVKIGRKCHVVLLSPPDVDNGVSELVSRLGSHLYKQGFNVSVDQWSRKEQCSLGPLPWLHAQLLKPSSQIVLILTHKALEKAEEWAHQQVIKTKGGEDKDVPQIWSPYSDVFTASLCIIERGKQLGRVQQRFLLVQFDSHPSSSRKLPKLLQGLPLFQLPAQTQALLAELTVGGAERGLGERTQTGWKWRVSDRWTVKTKEAPDQRKESPFKYLGVEEKMETVPLQLV